ncbi:MAG: hypothetical protein IE935_16315 [Micrococcales bacterium]|nr:hypothetical protein [Micrococcales bacterium]
MAATRPRRLSLIVIIVVLPVELNHCELKDVHHPRDVEHLGALIEHADDPTEVTAAVLAALDRGAHPAVAAHEPTGVDHARKRSLDLSRVDLTVEPVPDRLCDLAG